jgi:hypothetical protein
MIFSATIKSKLCKVTLNISMTTYYLYKKTHKTTNIKYLGFTRKNPYKYKGSGIRWVAHLKKHGNDVITEVLFETSNHNEIRTQGEYYSKLWNVVDSSDWANLKPEGGEGGGVPGMHKGKVRPKEHIDAMRAGWNRIKEEGYAPWNKGVTGLKGPCKAITLVDPQGKHYYYESLKKGCQEHNLIYTKMSSVNNGHYAHYKGWTILNPKKTPINIA